MILPYVESKSLELLEKDITIPPRQSKLCHFEFVARAVEESYKKKITLINVFNSHSNVEVEIRAKTTDTHQVLEHSALYSIFTRNNKKQLQVYYDNCISSMPNLRTFTIRNLSQKSLTFEFIVPPNSDLELYLLNSSDDSNNLKSKKQVDKSTSNYFTTSLGSNPDITSLDIDALNVIEKSRRISNNSKFNFPSSTSNRNFRRSSSFGNETDLIMILNDNKDFEKKDRDLEGKYGESHTQIDQNENTKFKHFGKDYIRMMDSPGFPFALLENNNNNISSSSSNHTINNNNNTNLTNSNNSNNNTTTNTNTTGLDDYTKDGIDIPMGQRQAIQSIKAVTLIKNCYQELQNVIILYNR